MSLKLMYITNDPSVAAIAEAAGVDRIFIDMEYIGKKARQGSMDSVQNHHTIDDIRTIRSSIQNAELMVRINPMHDAGQMDDQNFTDSKTEIDEAIQAGADVIMLPYFKTVEEIRRLIQYVDGRAKVFPLLETPEAVEVLDEILELAGLDAIHVGLNDLSLGKKKQFMFELLCDGTVQEIAAKCRASKVPFGFGGIASLGSGLLPAEYIVGEHYRLGSEYVILSRSFCDTSKITDLDEIREIFDTGVKAIRQLEVELETRVAEQDEVFFASNTEQIHQGVAKILELIAARSRQ